MFVEQLVLLFLISIALGALGPMVLWRKMSYFVDALAHSTIVAYGIVYCFNLQNDILFILLFAALFSVVFYFLNDGLLGYDGILAIITYFSMAVSGFLFMNENNTDSHDKSHELMDALFGGELLQENSNLLFLILLIIFIILFIKMRFRNWLLLIINKDLAKIKKLNTNRLSLEYKLMTGLVVGIAIKLYGILLTGGLLIIPAATAIYLARTYNQIVIYSILIVLLGNIFGYIVVHLNIRNSIFQEFNNINNISGLIVVINFVVFIVVKSFSRKKIRI